MSRHGRARVVVVGLKVLVLALVLAGGVAAVVPPKPPPSIDDMLGVWEVKFVEDTYYFDTGEKDHGKSKGTMTITYVEPSVVNLHIATEGAGSWDERAYYGDGLLVAGQSGDDLLGSWAETWYARVDGRSPHLHLEGPYLSYDVNGGWLDDGTMSARRIGSD